MKREGEIRSDMTISAPVQFEVGSSSRISPREKVWRQLTGRKAARWKRRHAYTREGVS